MAPDGDKIAYLVVVRSGVLVIGERHTWWAPTAIRAFRIGRSEARPMMPFMRTPSAV